MGYSTHFSLETDRPVDLSEAFEGTEVLGWALTESGETCDSASWYSHEKDMRAASARFPHVLFTLHGEGEEAGDLWNKYFRAGRMQVARAQIVYPPFDEALLK